jgi:transcription antitermination factor NusG
VTNKNKDKMASIESGDFVKVTGGQYTGLRGIVERVTTCFVKFQEENGCGMVQVLKKNVEKVTGVAIFGDDVVFLMAAMFS